MMLTSKIFSSVKALPASNQSLSLLHRSFFSPSGLVKTMPEPYKIKSVEYINLIPSEDRKTALKEAGYNTFLLKSRDVFIDLLTDSGTNAMSDRQWSSLMIGDEAYAGAESFYKFYKAIEDVYGFPYVVPTHQGRGAEHMISQSLIKKGSHVGGNMYFTTTRHHQELAGATFHDIIIDEGHNISSEHPFKGNVDIGKSISGAENIAYLSIGAPVNMAGGQPVSMANIRELKAYCDKHKIKLILDAARSVENCFFIKEREAGYRDKSIREILKELCSYFDVLSMSAKKDTYCNIGGLHTYGGLAGRDLEALATGVYEMCEETTIEHRISQVRYLGDLLHRAGVPVVRPIGGHAVFLDAKRFLSHLPQELFPAQSLAGHIYTEGGVRTMERGIVSAGRDSQGNNRKVPLELVRVTFPRRVYTQTHLDYVAQSIISLYGKRNTLHGLKFVYEPKALRFFQSRFEPANP